jgi:hypothetical protein
MSLLFTSNAYTREAKEFVKYGQQPINTAPVNSQYISALMTMALRAAVALAAHTKKMSLLIMKAIFYKSMLINILLAIICMSVSAT